MARKSLQELSGIANTIARSGAKPGEKPARTTAPALGALQGSLASIREIDPQVIDAWGPVAGRWLPSTAFATLLAVCAFLVVGTVTKNAFRIANLMCEARLGNRVAFDLRREYFGKVLDLDLAAFTDRGRGDLMNRAAGLGLGAGFLFSISGVSYRGASLSLGLDDPFARAGLTLAAVTAMQTLAMVVWRRWRDPGQVRAVWGARRVAVWVGLLSMAGSFCWFTAFTLQNAAYVNAVGQIELVFSALASVLVFRERVSGREWGGMAILMVSILTLVLVI